MARKKQKANILVLEGAKWVKQPIEGYVQDAGFGKIIIHGGHNDWTVSDYRCGVRMIYGAKTLASAVHTCRGKVLDTIQRQKLEETCKEYIKRLADGFIESFGVANE